MPSAGKEGSEGRCISACRNHSLEKATEPRSGRTLEGKVTLPVTGIEVQLGAPAGNCYLIELQETASWKQRAPRFGPLASTARLVKIQGISMFFEPIRRNRQWTRWLPKMQDFTEGTAVLYPQGRCWGFCKPESFTSFSAGSRRESLHRRMLHPLGMPAELTAGGDHHFQLLPAVWQHCGAHSRVSSPSGLHTRGHAGCPQNHLSRRC